MDEHGQSFAFDRIPSAETTCHGYKDNSTEVTEANLVFPGALLHNTNDLMRGHGTYTDNNGAIIASVAGITNRVNKLLRVNTVKSRYGGEVGDVVVGRIVEVQSSRWMVDINSTQFAVLLLSSVNLPGGELRRKSSEDQVLMTDYLSVGDLVSAEVQRTYSQGFVGLHTRSMKYGKLGQGVLVKVPYYLIKRRKAHFFNLPVGASLILGCNGHIWISTTKSIDENEQEAGGYIHSTESCGIESRQIIARLANCVKLLANHSIPLSDTTILMAFESSQLYEVNTLIDVRVAAQIAEDVIQDCKLKEVDL